MSRNKQQPKFAAFVVNAIRRLQSAQGSTANEITNFLNHEYELHGPEVKRRVQLVIKRGVNYGILQRSKKGYVTCDLLDDAAETADCGKCKRSRRGRSKRRPRMTRRRRKRSCRSGCGRRRASAAEDNKRMGHVARAKGTRKQRANSDESKLKKNANEDNTRRARSGSKSPNQGGSSEDDNRES